MLNGVVLMQKIIRNGRKRGQQVFKHGAVILTDCLGSEK